MVWRLERKGTILFPIFLSKAMGPGAMPGLCSALTCDGKKFPLCVFIAKAPRVKQCWLVAMAVCCLSRARA